MPRGGCSGWTHEPTCISQRLPFPVTNADFERVGKHSDAINVLSMILSARKYRQWTPVHEKIMEKYIQLTVTHRWKNVKKEFFQYRSICLAYPSPNVQSLGKIVKLYQEQSELALEEAIKTSAANAEETPDDLDDTPESIALQVSVVFAALFSLLLLYVCYDNVFC